MMMHQASVLGLFSILYLMASFCIGSPVIAAELKRQNIIPVLAADQAVITYKTIELEREQFDEISMYYRYFGQRSTARLDTEREHRKLMRLRRLFKIGSASRSKLLEQEVEHLRCQNRILYLEEKIRESLAKVKLLGLEIRGFGNPNTIDLRLEVMQALVDVHTYAKKSLLIRLRTVDREIVLAHHEYKSGLRLHQRKVISLDELEKRELFYRRMLSRKRSIAGTIRGKDNRIAALRKSIDRLR